MHEPLSQQLVRILEMKTSPGVATVNELIESTEGRGFYLVVIILSLPFAIPVSLPGVSTILGVIIFLLCFRMVAGLPLRLPKFLGDRPLPDMLRQRVVGGSIRILRLVERMVKPRRTHWMSLRGAQAGNGLLMMFMAALLALPFPPLPPLTNSLPSYSLILIAASMMEEDGTLIWVGYALALGTIFYLASIAAVLERAISWSLQLMLTWGGG